MGSTIVDVTYGFAAGEEVVVRLQGIEVFELDSSRVLSASALPAWTIAEIVTCELSGGGPAYTLRFGLGDATCVCVVPESAIDGTA